MAKREPPPPAIHTDEWARFLRLRTDLFNEISAALEVDGHCKDYEGLLMVSYELPGYFYREDRHPVWGISLDCYVIGPSRHYSWRGPTFADALVLASRDIRRWIREGVDDA